MTDRYQDLAETLRTEIEVETIVGRLRKQGWEHVRHSTDPGRFLCEFVNLQAKSVHSSSWAQIYYASLAEAKLASHGKSPLVLFVHVPSYGTDASGSVDADMQDNLCPYNMSDLQTLLKAVIWQVALRTYEKRKENADALATNGTN